MNKKNKISYNLDEKKFTSISNSPNGEVDDRTIFSYHQQDNLVWADCEGGQILKGNLIVKVGENGNLDMRNHYINKLGVFMLGTCISEPVFLSNGKIKFKENWRWLTGDQSSGYSEIIEI